MTIHKQGRSKAFTLVELSLAIGIGMTISALSLALFQQQHLSLAIVPHR
jgi:hypothetical protein